MPNHPRTILSAIVAMSKNRVIGKNNQLPWHLPADLKHFKTITTGHPILMGRKTYESIGRPLPNRTNLVLTRDPSFKAEGCLIVHSLDEALHYCNKQQHSELFVIGGADIYRLCLANLQKLYLTQVDAEIEGDAFFPELNLNEWDELSCEAHGQDETHEYPFRFMLYRRK